MPSDLQYMSFLELGLVTLSKEQAWLPLAILRTSTVSKIDAGMSQVFGLIIKSFSGAVCHTDLSQAGIMLLDEHSQAVTRFFCTLGMFLQDGAAHKAIFHCKGDSGSKLCMECLNLFTEKSKVVDED